MSCSQNHSSPSAAPTPARTDPNVAKASANPTQTKLAGTESRRCDESILLAANWMSVPRRSSQKICETAHFSNQERITTATGQPSATSICQTAGGAVPVLRGTKVKRNPSAKQVRNPSICASAWKIDRYSGITPTAKKIQCRTPAQASSIPRPNSGL